MLKESVLRGWRGSLQDNNTKKSSLGCHEAYYNLDAVYEHIFATYESKCERH